MIFGKAEFAELKAKAFKVPERLNTGVDVALFSEVPVSFMCWKHHGDPVIAGVIHNFFRGYAIYIFHKYYFSCRVLEGQAKACRTRQKRDMV